MKKTVLALFIAVSFIMLLFAQTASASDNPVFPDKGWHKGWYVTGNFGMMRVTNDSHSVTNRKFAGSWAPSFGLTVGWDYLDWLGTMLQFQYATTTGHAGDPANVMAKKYGSYTYPAGTFSPVENAREHAMDIGVYMKATLPYFTHAGWQPNAVKILPYVKLGGLAHVLYVNASKSENKAGAVGGGIGIGGGCEFYIWKGLYVGLDMTEAIIFQKGFTKNLTDNTGTTRSVKITSSDTVYQFNLMGMVGWHF